MKVIKSLILFVIISCCYAHNSVAQQLVKTILVENARMITTDELGNVYLVGQDNGLTRYDLNGDSTGNFRSVTNGDLLWVDATNPLRVLLYYPNFSKVILLDRMLSVKNELDLKKLSLFNPPAVGMSADGRIWVYDFQTARLKKIDDQLNMTHIGNDMRIESQTVPRPSSLIEKESKVYLCDPKNGLYTFDRFASYINTMEIKNVSRLQAFGSQLIYRNNDSLMAYDLKTLSLKTIPLPIQNDFIDVRIERSRLYFLYKEKLEIYNVPEE